ncbi:MAG: hypothetical protein R2788_21920 [Saprospiraceae bacterium]
MSPPKIPIGQDFTSATEKNLTTETDDAIFHYRLDDIAVTEGIFDAEDSTLHILLTDSLPQSGKSVFTINAFNIASQKC